MRWTGWRRARLTALQCRRHVAVQHAATRHRAGGSPSLPRDGQDRTLPVQWQCGASLLSNYSYTRPPCSGKGTPKQHSSRRACLSKTTTMEGCPYSRAVERRRPRAGSAHSLRNHPRWKHERETATRLACMAVCGTVRYSQVRDTCPVYSIVTLNDIVEYIKAVR